MAKKVALITGAGTGIGKGCVLKFLENDYRVVMVGRTINKLEQLFNELNTNDAIYFQGDVSNQDRVNSIIDEVIELYGRLDVVVNNAGICISAPFIDLTYEQYDEVIKVNQYGTYFYMQAAAKKMIEHKIKGAIVNVSSVYGVVTSPNIFPYHASKAAISMMSKSAASELAPYGIRVVAVAPGVIDTPMIEIDKVRGTWDKLQSKHMREKALSPEEVAEVIVFLCSEKANGINGTVIAIDDGLLSKG